MDLSGPIHCPIALTPGQENTLPTAETTGS